MPDAQTLLIFPHQLFEHHPGLNEAMHHVLLIEDGLFFGDHQYPAAMHQQKLWLHRATMQRYAQTLASASHHVQYIEHQMEVDVLEQSISKLAEDGCKHVITTTPHDAALERRLTSYCRVYGITLQILDTPMFLNTAEDNQNYRATTSKWYMADFYKHQRRRLNILMTDHKPAGGSWSFDADNRKKVPKAMLQSIPQIPTITRDTIDSEAKRHVMARYTDNPGSLDTLQYPTSHAEARKWLDEFLKQRFACFGDYEDAMVAHENWLWHSVLTPLLNIGLLTPRQVIDAALLHAETHQTPLNSTEGFIRQIIGWREFVRATYDDLGSQMRTANHWNHHRPMPACFYHGNTGLAPVDDVIRRVLQHGYCHHIERLMVLGGLMFLCEIHPDHIYKWFMEMFVDSYDWVMVPNVYGMSQHADGGLITTKPYFSGSAYIRKMSNHPKGAWCDTWDGLYWRWIWNHHDALRKSPRWSMMCAMARKMDTAKRDAHIARAEDFLTHIHRSS